MTNVEAYVHYKPDLISADGKISDDSTSEFLRNYMEQFHEFVVRVLKVLPRQRESTPSASAAGS
jgi:chromate reductase